MSEYDYLNYANQGATRNRPLAPELAQALSFLPEMGVTMEVFSGGQPGIGEGGNRVGSTRHDHGQSADVFFYQNGRRLDWANPDDIPIYQDIVRRGRANGLTGFGAGQNYMQPGSMHVGFGAPAVWGAGGSSANAPDWLREAYGSAPSGASQTASAPRTPQTALPGMPPPQNALAAPQQREPWRPTINMLDAAAFQTQPQNVLAQFYPQAFR